MASLALSLIGSLFGGGAGLFGRKTPTQETNNTNTSGSSNSNINSTTSPVLSDYQEMLAKLFTSGLANRYNQGPADLSGYEAGGLRDINSGADLKSKIVANTLASRGLSYSPYAASQLSNVESQRVGQGVDFMSQIPLLRRSLEQQDLNGLIQGFGALPTATTTSGSQNNFATSNSSQHGTQVTNENPLAALLSGAGGGLLSGWAAGKPKN